MNTLKQGWGGGGMVLAPALDLTTRFEAILH